MHLLGAQVLKPVHPATKLCTPGAVCTLNFEHCQGMLNWMKHEERPIIEMTIMFVTYKQDKTKCPTLWTEGPLEFDFLMFMEFLVMFWCFSMITS